MISRPSSCIRPIHPLTLSYVNIVVIAAGTARIMFVPIDKDGKAGAPKPFAEGWLTQDGEYLGRPTDVAVLLDGSLLVADDTAGAIYRISYEGK